MTAPDSRLTPINRASTVLALVPHYRCERWLCRAIESLVSQSRPPDAVAVIDDGSTSLPEEIVKRFPEVTLLASSSNVGPYRLIQRVIDQTDYDAYLFQDADDWSASARLEHLIDHAEETGADLIGSFEVRVDGETAEETRFMYPLDVNKTLIEDPTVHCLLHPTSIVSKALICRIGGFATGLRFGADNDFLRRAHHAARIVNMPRFDYFRRRRDESLTNASDTGMDSVERKRLRAIIAGRALENARAASEGRLPDLAPLSTSPPVPLTRVLGPRLRGDMP